MRLKDLLGINMQFGDERFGVEVEMEGRGLVDPPKNWGIEQDGSLQGGIEYVMLNPGSYEQTLSDIENLYKEFAKRGSVLNPSIRSGIHVHYNVSHWSVLQFVNFMCLYLTVENIMIKSFAGNGRFGNLFCIPASRAEIYTKNLVEYFQTKDPRLLNDDNIRYSALNLNSLFKYGTIEFRSLGTPRTPAPLITWIEIIRNIVRFSSQFNNPQDILNNFSNLIDAQYLSNVFGYPIEDFDKMDFYEGVEQAQLLAFMTSDWQMYVEQLKEQKPKRAKKPKMMEQRIMWEQLNMAPRPEGRPFNIDNLVREIIPEDNGD